MVSSITSANNGAAFLASVPSSTGGNWVQDVANNTTSGADWMDPSASSGTDAVTLAANAFASAEQIQMTNKNSLAVNTGMAVLSKQMTGQTVNLFA